MEDRTPILEKSNVGNKSSNKISNGIYLSTHINHEYLNVAGVYSRYATCLAKCGRLYFRKLFSCFISQRRDLLIIKSFRDDQTLKLTHSFNKLFFFFDIN